MKKYIITVDFGGTFIRAALFEGDKIRKKIKEKTFAAKGKTVVMKRVCNCIDLLLKGVEKKNVKGIAIAVPGPLDSERGILFEPPNVPLCNTNLVKLIGKKFRLETRIENDAKCAALAEARARKKDLICLTLGTGVGSGIILGGKIYKGTGIATEFGHMIINFDGPKCHCGNYGCLEEYVSVRGIIKIARQLGLKEKNIKKLGQMARKGDKKARKLFTQVGFYLGIGLANIVNAMAPELIVLAGGLSNLGSLIIRPAIVEMKKRAFKSASKKVKIKTTKLGDDAGLIGASYLF